MSSHIKKEKEYDLIINVRWDFYINPDLDLKKLNMDYSYVDHQSGFSPVFFGDFILITKKNILTDFFETIYNNYENSQEINLWGKNMFKLKNKYSKGRFINNKRMSIWANQCQWAYYLYKNEIFIEKIKHMNLGFIKKITI